MAFNHSINSAIEKSIVNYLNLAYNTSGSYLNQLSSSITAGGGNVYFYTGINNTDKTASAVTVDCKTATEVAWNTRVYAMDIEVTCAEMAADNTIGLGILPMYVFNEFVSSSIAASNFTTNSISVYQCQIQGFDQSIDGDAILSKGMFRIAGGLTGL